MKTRYVILSACFILLFFLPQSECLSQYYDPGIRDTVRLGSLTTNLNGPPFQGTAVLPIVVFNDEYLSSVDIPLKWTGPIVGDSGKFIGERKPYLNDPFIYMQPNHCELYFNTPWGQPYCPPGDDTLIMLYFTIQDTGLVVFDTIGGGGPEMYLYFVDSTLHRIQPYVERPWEYQIESFHAQQDTLVLLGVNNDLNQARGVAANGRYAFVADWDSGIYVSDYAVPSLPTTITEYTESPVLDIEINRDLAYYVGMGRFYIRDISNPLQSNVVGSCTGYDWDNYGIRVHLYDTLAIVLHKTGYEATLLKIIDISDPTSPHVLSTLSPPPYGTIAWGDAVKNGDYLFWVDDVIEILRGRIIVYNISNPAAPVFIKSDTILNAYAYAISIKDNKAYVAEGYGGRGLMVFDVSDPYNIDSVGCFPIPEGRAWNVYIKGNYAYVCAHLKPTLPSDRIYVLDISVPTKGPTLVTYYDTPGCPRDVFVDEPYVLVAEDTSLLVFRASFLRTPGDVNNDGQVDIGDVVYLINYLFKHSIAPEPIESGDVNGDCVVDVGDVVYLINYLFKNGALPQSGCTLP